jgi:hypothetical protein
LDLVYVDLIDEDLEGWDIEDSHKHFLFKPLYCLIYSLPILYYVYNNYAKSVYGMDQELYNAGAEEPQAYDITTQTLQMWQGAEGG